MITPRTVRLEEDNLTPHHPHSPKVIIEHHQPDFENLFDDVFQWSMDLIEREDPVCLFVNPAAAIYCCESTPEFFTIARKKQSQWCQRFIKTLGRRAIRKVKDWPIGPEDHLFSKRELKFRRVFQRSLCFTGLLIIEGKTIPSNRWPDRDSKSFP